MSGWTNASTTALVPDSGICGCFDQQPAHFFGIYAGDLDPLRPTRFARGECHFVLSDTERRGDERGDGRVRSAAFGRRRDPHLQRVAMAADDTGFPRSCLDVEAED